jgi:Bax protein
MGKTSKRAEPIGRVERGLLGFLAALFLATLLSAVLLPREAFRFIPERPPAGQSVDPEIAFGPTLKMSVARVKDTATLRRLLREADYDPTAIRVGQAPVPALFLASLPEDLAKVKSVRDRKDLFIGIVLPLILNTNSVVLERRARLARLMSEKFDALTDSDRQWLLRLARLYRVIGPDATIGDLDAKGLGRLFRRVDAVPVSMALAQSAAESGWGRSRFAKRGNALFGQWTWNEDAGLVPGDREEGRTHAVRAFSRLGNSVRAYVHNLNISQHYRAYRSARERLRNNGSPDGTWGHELIGYLDKYSEEGTDYIEKIRSIIRVNEFGDFETAHIGADIVPEESAGSGS